MLRKQRGVLMMTRFAESPWGRQQVFGQYQDTPANQNQHKQSGRTQHKHFPAPSHHRLHRREKSDRAHKASKQNAEAVNRSSTFHSATHCNPLHTTEHWTVIFRLCLAARQGTTSLSYGYSPLCSTTSFHSFEVLLWHAHPHSSWVPSRYVVPQPCHEDFGRSRGETRDQSRAHELGVPPPILQFGSRAHNEH